MSISRTTHRRPQASTRALAFYSRSGDWIMSGRPRAVDEFVYLFERATGRVLEVSEDGTQTGAMHLIDVSPSQIARSQGMTVTIR